MTTLSGTHTPHSNLLCHEFIHTRSPRPVSHGLNRPGRWDKPAASTSLWHWPSKMEHIKLTTLSPTEVLCWFRKTKLCFFLDIGNRCINVDSEKNRASKLNGRARVSARRACSPRSCPAHIRRSLVHSYPNLHIICDASSSRLMASATIAGGGPRIPARLELLEEHAELPSQWGRVEGARAAHIGQISSNLHTEPR